MPFEGIKKGFSLLWQLSYLSTVSDTAAIGPVFDSRQLPVLYNDGHWAHVSPYTSSFDFAETCGFNNQSPATFFCDSSLTGALLLANVRSEFAEFLNHGSLDA